MYQDPGLASYKTPLPHADPARLLAAARRQHFSYFVMKVFETLHPGEPPLERAWYIEAMCHALSEVHHGRLSRLVVTVPPRHLKSVTTAVAWVAWMLGHNPGLKVMVASYSQDLARLHSNLTRTVMESAWYKSDFPATRISDRGNRALELETTAGGVRKAVSVGGTVTGFGADIIIVDDCMKADEARSPTERENLRSWYDNTLLTRLNSKSTGRIVSIQQRLHEDDLPAYLLEKGYTHLNLPAIAEREERVPIGPGRFHHRHVGDLLDPLRESRETLERIRRDVGPVVFAAQYQQNPIAPEGNLIHLEWFGTYHEVPPREHFHKVIQSWDTGMTANPRSDPSVCTTWGFKLDDHKWYLLHVYRERLEYPDLRRAIMRLWDHYRPECVLIEKAGSGYALWPDLKNAGYHANMVKPIAAKEERFNGCLGEIEGGHFLLPVEAPWLEAFRAELKAFPHGKHDDQADSFSQFVNWQLRKWPWILEPATTSCRRSAIQYEQRPWGSKRC